MQAVKCQRLRQKAKAAAKKRDELKPLVVKDHRRKRKRCLCCRTPYEHAEAERPILVDEALFLIGAIVDLFYRRAVQKAAGKFCSSAVKCIWQGISRFVNVAGVAVASAYRGIFVHKSRHDFDLSTVPYIVLVTVGDEIAPRLRRERSKRRRHAVRLSVLQNSIGKTRDVFLKKRRAVKVLWAVIPDEKVEFSGIGLTIQGAKLLFKPLCLRPIDRQCYRHRLPYFHRHTSRPFII